MLSLEKLVEDYERVAEDKLSSDLKLVMLIRRCPGTLRQHLGTQCFEDYLLLSSQRSLDQLRADYMKMDLWEDLEAGSELQGGEPER